MRLTIALGNYNYSDNNYYTCNVDVHRCYFYYINVQQLEYKTHNH